MKNLSDVILWKHNDDHKEFMNLIKSMLVIDPRKRPQAEECLKHPFFARKVVDETERTLARNEGLREVWVNHSKSTEKTGFSTKKQSPQSEKQ